MMFFKGMSFGFMAKNGYFSGEAGKAEIQNVIHSGANAVALIVTMMQESFASTRVFRDFIITPSDDEVRETIRTFRQAGLKVMLKPILECHDSTHRGEINFPEDQQQIAGIVTDYWGEWFRNYTAAMVHYARLCELEGAEMLLLGCEMTGADKREKYWPVLIDEVRKVYHGLLAYNTPSWWDYSLDQNWLRKWFSKLDMLGVSNYYGTGMIRGMKMDEITTENIARGMTAVAENLDEAYKTLHIPIFMAEFGIGSYTHAILQPSSAWKSGEVFDGEIQSMYLEGTMKAFEPYPWWSGFFWWKWDEQQYRPNFHHPSGDLGFTIKGKPAEKTFKNWVIPADKQ